MAEKKLVKKKCFKGNICRVYKPKKKVCKFGVNKRTGKCLKSKR